MWTCFQLVFLRKPKLQSRFYHLLLQYISHLYFHVGICNICCCEDSGCSQRVQIIQSNSQLLHKRTFLLPLTCYAFPSPCLVLARTPVWCLRRQFRKQNQQKISPAKRRETFLPLSSLNQATAGSDMYQQQHRDGRGKETSQACKAQPSPLATAIH